MYDIIVTGATGFIGKELIKHLIKKYSKSKILCLVWDNDSEFEQKGRRVIKSFGLAMKHIDLRTNKGLTDLPKNPKIIIHLAASAETSSSDHRANYPGTKHLINAFPDINSNTHVVYLSTTAIYSGRNDCSSPINLSTRLQPSNEYGRTKLEAERWLIDSADRNKFRLTILRLSTVFGKEPRKNGMFDQLENTIKTNSMFGIWNRMNWPGLTSLVYKSDVCDVIMQYLKYPPKPGETQTQILATHSMTLSQISKLTYHYFGKSYREVHLNTGLWKIAKHLRTFIPYLERVLPSSIYNYFWRASIIIDSSLNCELTRFLGKNVKWKQIHLKDKMDEVFGS